MTAQKLMEMEDLLDDCLSGCHLISTFAIDPEILLGAERIQEDAKALRTNVTRTKDLLFELVKGVRQ